MTIQEMLSDDTHQLAGIQPEGWSEVGSRFESYTASHFCFPLKAVVDSKIVGVGTSIMHDDVAWLAHIIVHSDYRNQGIGASLTQELVDRAKNKQCKTICLSATELGEIVYKKLGFLTETEYIFFKNDKSPNWPISKQIIPVQEEMINEILDFDKKHVGEDRSNSIKAHVLNGKVYKSGKGIDGYYLPTLVDGPIVATTPKAGIELMKYRLQDRNDISFPADNLAAKGFMAELGLPFLKSEKRMRLGRDRGPLFSSIYNRIGGKVG